MKGFGRILKRGACVVSMAILAACEVPPPPAGETTPGIGPGPFGMTGDQAVALFSQVCLATAPSYATAPAVIAELPFRQSPTTGTYYHQRFNASVKISDDGCSFVGAGRQLNPLVDTNSLLDADPTGRTLPRPPRSANGLTYISVVRPRE
ncbi:MAG: hypothetical protein AAF841_10260 [Pseudomonadota bacterium]